MRLLLLCLFCDVCLVVLCIYFRVLFGVVPFAICSCFVVGFAFALCYVCCVCCDFIVLCCLGVCRLF